MLFRSGYPQQLSLSANSSNTPAGDSQLQPAAGYFSAASLVSALTSGLQSRAQQQGGGSVDFSLFAHQLAAQQQAQQQQQQQQSLQQPTQTSNGPSSLGALLDSSLLAGKLAAQQQQQRNSQTELANGNSEAQTNSGPNNSTEPQCANNGPQAGEQRQASGATNPFIEAAALVAAQQNNSPNGNLQQQQQQPNLLNDGK